MKKLLNCSLLIRAVVIIVVIAFMASSVTNTYAQGGPGAQISQHGTDIKAAITQHDTDTHNDLVLHDGNMTTEHNSLSTDTALTSQLFYRTLTSGG